MLWWPLLWSYFWSYEYLTLALWPWGKKLLWWSICYCVYWTQSVFHYCLNKDIWQLKNFVFPQRVLLFLPQAPSSPKKEAESPVIRLFILQGQELYCRASDLTAISSYWVVKSTSLTITFLLFTIYLLNYLTYISWFNLARLQTLGGLTFTVAATVGLILPPTII